MRKSVGVLLMGGALALTGCGGDGHAAARTAPTTATSSASATAIGRKADDIAASCLSAYRSSTTSPPSLGAQVRALIHAFRDHSSAPGAVGFLQDAAQVLRGGCGARYAGSLDAVIRTASTTTTPAAGASTSPAPAAPTSTTTTPAPAPTVVTGRSSGHYAVAHTNGTFRRPSQLLVQIGATPPQRGTLSYSVVCDEIGGNVSDKTGQLALQLPATQKLPVPAPSHYCLGSASVQLSGSGSVTLSITG